MKAQYITCKSATHPHLLSMLASLALLSSVSVATADNLLVNTFDSGLSGIAWENWRSYVTGHDRVWDPSQDADGNASCRNASTFFASSLPAANSMPA